MNEQTIPENLTRSAFVGAVDAAFQSNAIRPCIRYSVERGFQVESLIHRAIPSDIWQSGEVHWDARTGRRSILKSDWTRVRDQILSNLA